MVTVWEEHGVVVRTLASHAEDLGSNPKSSFASFSNKLDIYAVLKFMGLTIISRMVKDGRRAKTANTKEEDDTRFDWILCLPPMRPAFTRSNRR